MKRRSHVAVAMPPPEADGPQPQVRPPTLERTSDPLRQALLESRQRWRDLVTLGSDIAFETDAWGRFVFIAPDPALGWPTNMLIGQPAETILADSAGLAGFNPFRPTTAVRRRRAWLKRSDQSVACVSVAAAPLLDSDGRIIGARGVGIDVTEEDGQDAKTAAALRRGEVVDHILWRMRQEVMAPRMMQAALDGLVNALGAEGAAVFDVGAEASPITYQVGRGAAEVRGTALSLLRTGTQAPIQASDPDGRQVIVCACQTRFGDLSGLGLWRSPGSRAWDGEDYLLASSASSIIRVVLEHDAIQREMARQARTDPLTGLLNRRAFLEELARHIDRLDRDGEPGTLMFADIDNFKPLNDRLGHELGDEALKLVARIIRDAVRPADLVARLGGDEFAVWMSGADALTAAERAEMLRVQMPPQLASLFPEHNQPLTMSIGIACRDVRGAEDIPTLIRRADLAMFEVKRSGRAHWRVSPGACS